MNLHYSEEELILLFYRESDAPEGMAAHLKDCEPCRVQYEELAAGLKSIPGAEEPPRRSESYGTQVWAKIREQLPEERSFDWKSVFLPRRLAAVGAMAALVFFAFMLGRVSRPVKSPMDQPLSQQDRQRILLAGIGNHLDGSQRLLLEIENAQTGGSLDISNEQRRAEDLVESNRLYRQVALRSGDVRVAGVLDDLERVLLEIANSPSQIASADLGDIQRQIENQGILFKLRVMDDQIHQREAQSPGSGNRSRI
ncbi:MAG: hypothetical protein PHX83_01325 [Acidobacteriia bacterium]|nr:hypothetical protein [Terriglobia bacterium]